MANLSTQTILRTGLTPAYVAADVAGDRFSPGDVFFHAKNGSAGAITITFVTPSNVGGLAVADLAVTIPAGEERMIGPFDARYFTDPVDNRCPVTYSGVTSLTVAVFKMT